MFNSHCVNVLKSCNLKTKIYIIDIIIKALLAVEKSVIEIKNLYHSIFLLNK